MPTLTQIALIISAFTVSQIFSYWLSIGPIKAQEKRIDEAYDRVIEELKKGLK